MSTPASWLPSVLWPGAQSGRLVTVCSACHHVLKRVNYEMAHSEAMAERVNNYMAPDMSYHGETQVLHYLEMLRDVVGFDNLKKQVKSPLKGRRIGAYYGCLLLRPSKEMEFDDPENPSILEESSGPGGRAVLYAQRNECCSGYVALESRRWPKSAAPPFWTRPPARGPRSSSPPAPFACIT